MNDSAPKSKYARNENIARTQQRNYMILRLRGCYATLRALQTDNAAIAQYAATAQTLLDNILQEMGAEREDARRERYRKALHEGTPINDREYNRQRRKHLHKDKSRGLSTGDPQ